ncbi:hypothetical protein MAPG_04338 [Magnaporthiopsis poae ATCC 64411]|uniref:Dynactin subunit 2 n=1 Tax=Magnaporthiopsis poae (strain ATCC 64411 / 73-15) TaxID=644358 RepID=A0A0C4DWG0_MAGP6|nr:hypothetical protein MAPG_04338 [Magnaporthiopsis poae ATCC 64411]
MALNRKYSALPDLDTAPDIYETPDLTDDNSTVPTGTVKSQSDEEDDYGREPSEGVLRSRLKVSEARSRFTPANVDARDVDFSDRVSGKRKSYKVSTRRHRTLEDGTLELGDLSDDDDNGADSLARKIARLKREVEEARAECAKQQGTSSQEADIDSLSRALESISGLTSRQEPVFKSAPVPELEPQPAADDSSAELPPATGGATYTVTYAPTYQQSHALAKAADFDKRLLFLEKSLGIGSSAAPELDAGGLPRAVLPMLEMLDKQVGALASATPVSLDTLTRRVRALNQEAESVDRSRQTLRASREMVLVPMTETGGTALSAAEAEAAQRARAVASDLREYEAKINALYGTLPTIENLAPLLPPLLDRLRSLRAIHADAAAAGDTLDRIDRSQAETAAEIKQWREGLEKVEAAMREGETSMEGNAKAMEGWVTELEQRIAKLS